MSSPEIMRRIVEAEKLSQERLREAEIEITKMRNDIPNRIASMREGATRKAAQERDRMLTEAENEGKEEAERIALETKRQIDALSRIPEVKRKEAVEKAIALLLG